MTIANRGNQGLIAPTNSLPLENGDRLNRYEFERRYHAMPDKKKAELIEGIVYMASPLRAKSHGKPHTHIMTWLGTYEAMTPGVEALDNATVIFDFDNEPQPDALLRIEEGGSSRITADDYVDGAPELIVEIAASTASIDSHKKMQVYRRSGVQEYIIWRVNDGELDWFYLKDGEYLQRSANSAGVICSEVFPGLWLDKTALLSGDLAKVLASLQPGLASAEHQQFVESLAQAEKSE
jgi:Uma2 family endonuclease